MPLSLPSLVIILELKHNQITKILFSVFIYHFALFIAYVNGKTAFVFLSIT